MLTRMCNAYHLLLSGLRTVRDEGWRSAWLKGRRYVHSLQWRESIYPEWITENEPSYEELLQQRELSKNFFYSPCISIITPVFNPDPSILTSTIQSVLDQTYENWEFCIVDGNSDNPELKCILHRFSGSDPRFKVRYLHNNQGISGNSNIAISMATGDFILFLDHDDTLAPFALYEIVKALNKNDTLDLLYSDRDLLSEDGTYRFDPLFKPDWSPEMLLSVNYLSHLCVIRRSILNTIGFFDSEMDGAQDWDLFFRITEKTDKISHIPKILYHWRSIKASCATRGHDAKPYIITAQRKAIQKHLERCNQKGDVRLLPQGWGNIQWEITTDKLVSIIIPSKNVSLLKICLDSFFSLTSYSNYEIIVIDTGIDPAIDPAFIEKISNLQNFNMIRYKKPFNYSAVNNTGSQYAKGEIILFLNDDIRVISPDWLSEMVAWAIKDGIGVVGAKLLYPNNTIQHAGVVLGLTGFAGHPFQACADHTMGLFGSTDWYRNYSAVTGACMMVRRAIFDEIGGFDEDFILCGSDVEFCLRVRKKGYRILYTPFAVLEHLESASRGCKIPQEDYLLSMRYYSPIVEKGDPFFNPNLSLWDCTPNLRKPGEKLPIEYIKGVLKNES